MSAYRGTEFGQLSFGAFDGDSSWIDWSAYERIVEMAWEQMQVEVRKGIAMDFVVHLDR